MEARLADKYKHVKFEGELLEMFTSILVNDEASSKVLTYIAMKTKEHKSGPVEGITISDIVENVKLERKVRKRKGRNIHYEKEITNIDRKAAERVVDKLLNMSLLYYQPMSPYKMLFLTGRGAQVIRELMKMKQRKEEEKNGENVYKE